MKTWYLLKASGENEKISLKLNFTYLLNYPMKPTTTYLYFLP